jgi:phosphate transport system substrate-binding protein
MGGPKLGQMQEQPMSLLKLSTSLIAITALSATAAMARDQVQVTGSSTVLPYATIVAEAFGENFDFPSPVVEGGGSGAGRKKLCEGVGENTVDVANSSSRISQSDIDLCKTNGVNEIMEVRIGYDGIVFASDVAGPAFAMTPAAIYGALAAKVAKDGALVDNTAATWADADATLPAQAILAFIPGTKHGTREVFDTKVIVEGCKANGAYDLFLATAEGADDKEKGANAAKACNELRTDGKSVDVDGDYTETLARIAADKTAVGVFGLSFYQNNTDKLQVATMNGIVPSTESIAKGEYPVSRPLYFYVKKAHIGVIPGLKEYINFFVSDDMAGPDGPLAEYGLVSDPDLKATQAMVAAETAMGPLE